jgi:protein arginine kinase activator
MSGHCDHCEKPAVVHETIIKNGEQLTVHLCEEHAAMAGKLPPHQPVHALLTQFALFQPAGGVAVPSKSAKAAKACPGCGITFAHVRQSGNFGCAECYATFGDALRHLIERAQGGANFHVGRAPRGERDAGARLEIRSRLARELDEAVSAEQYERAAELRDRLLHLKDEAIG